MPRDFKLIENGHQRGFGLVEIMIAMMLGLMVIAVVTGVFLSSNRNYSEDDQFSRLQENGRFATKLLMDDLSMASFWGTLVNTNIGSTLTTCNGSIPINTTNPLRVLNQPTAGTVNTTYPCIATNSYYQDPDDTARSDVLLVKRVQGQVATPDTNSRPYLQIVNTAASSTISMLNNSSTMASGAVPWEYIARLYYIRNYSVTAGDGIPTLCRKYIVGTTGSTPLMEDEPLVEGIENFQIEFGIDTTNDGIADKYLTNPTPAEMGSVFNARIYVLARTLTEDPLYKSNTDNHKKYNLGSTPIARKNDGYRRRVFSTNVSVRNITNFAELTRASR